VRFWPGFVPVTALTARSCPHAESAASAPIVPPMQGGSMPLPPRTEWVYRPTLSVRAAAATNPAPTP